VQLHEEESGIDAVGSLTEARPFGQEAEERGMRERHSCLQRAASAGVEDKLLASS
jgi:hypothetical protein